MRALAHKLKAAVGIIAVAVALGATPSGALAEGSGGAAPPGLESAPAPPPPPTAPSGGCPSATPAIGGVSTPAGGCGHPYVNPFRGGSWLASRTDMGVDYLPGRREAVVAIGDAKILGSSRHSGWPGGGFIWYRLLDGSHAGDVVYVAEHLVDLAKAGTRIRAGQPIAVAIPGDPWTEWGWATPGGEPRAAPCYREGMQTNSGREMARFLLSLGATVLDRAEQGPDRPAGRLC